MTAKEFREKQGYSFDHFTKLTQTGISPNYDNIELFAEEYATQQLQLGGVSLRSFNQKIESYEIALKYSEELKEYDKVYTLTIKLAALRLAKSDFFPHEI